MYTYIYVYTYILCIHAIYIYPPAPLGPPGAEASLIYHLPSFPLSCLLIWILLSIFPGLPLGFVDWMREVGQPRNNKIPPRTPVVSRRGPLGHPKTIKKPLVLCGKLKIMVPKWTNGRGTPPVCWLQQHVFRKTNRTNATATFLRFVALFQYFRILSFFLLLNNSSPST